MKLPQQSIEQILGSSAVNREFGEKIKELDRRLKMNGMSYPGYESMTDRQQEILTQGLFLEPESAIGMDEYVKTAVDNCGCEGVREDLHHHSPILMREIETEEEKLPDLKIRIGESLSGLDQTIDLLLEQILQEQEPETETTPEEAVQNLERYAAMVIFKKPNVSSAIKAASQRGGRHLRQQVPGDNKAVAAFFKKYGLSLEKGAAYDLSSKYGEFTLEATKDIPFKIKVKGKEYELSVPKGTKLPYVNPTAASSAEKTGKEITFYKGFLASSPPQASRFTPNSPVGFSTTTDVGTQFGSTFDGVTTFDSQAYFVPPGGNTRERNRGRGVISGGRNRSTMEFINIQSQGNSQEFGDSVTGDGIEGFALGSSTRGLFSGPQSPLSNVIEFITFATQSNGTDFGDTTSARRSGAGAGNDTRGLFAGGIYQASSPYGGINITDFVTIATAGNATDFGDLNTANEQAAPNADTTRVVIAGGTINGGNSVNNIDFFTIATTGNATDFGDMTTAHGAGAGGASSSTRGLIAGGVSPDKLNTISFITIQTTGNSSNYGDLTSARGYPSGMSNSTRGVFAGGYQPTQINAIDFVNIATTGNANDFGDLSLGVNFVTQATSDCHGGLS